MLEAGPSSISERERWKEMNKKDFEPNQRYVERRKYKRGAHLQDPIGYFPVRKDTDDGLRTERNPNNVLTSSQKLGENVVQR